MPEALIGLLANLIYILIILAGFSVVIFFHELGHFAAAKWVGIQVDRFAIGFGNRLVGYRRGEGITFGKPRNYAEGNRPPNLGETDYCLNALPLGGYVKMLGQEDFAEETEEKKQAANPRSFHSKTVGQRMLVISAGVFMNLVFAVLALVIVFMAGLQSLSPVVGNVMPYSPADHAGFQPGDRVLAVNGEKVHDFEDIAHGVVLTPGGHAAEFVINRGGQEMVLNAEPEHLDEDASFRKVGIGPLITTQLFADSAFELPGERQLLAGDRITQLSYYDAIRDEQVSHPAKSFQDVIKAYFAAAGAPVELTIERAAKDGQPAETFTVFQPPLIQAIPMSGLAQSREPNEIVGEHILGLRPLRQALVRAEDSPAARAGFQDGDAILQVGPIKWPNLRQMQEHFIDQAGQPVEVRVRRADGSEHTLSIAGPVGSGLSWSQPLGLNFDSIAADAPAVVAGIEPTDAERVLVSKSEKKPTVVIRKLGDPRKTPGNEAQIPVGATVVEVAGEPTPNWRTLLNVLVRNASAEQDRQVPLTYVDEAGQAHTTQFRIPQINAVSTMDPLTLKETGYYWNNAIVVLPPFDFLVDTVIIRASNPLEAISMGITRMVRALSNQYRSFMRMATGDIAVTNMRGPVGIIDVGRQIAQVGWVHVLLFLGQLSVALAVFNFLPIPVVDGGHMMFLLIEKFRGKPAPERVQIAAVLIGLAVILCFGLMVTAFDLMRIAGII